MDIVVEGDENKPDQTSNEPRGEIATLKEADMLRLVEDHRKEVEDLKKELNIAVARNSYFVKTLSYRGKG